MKKKFIHTRQELLPRELVFVRRRARETINPLLLLIKKEERQKNGVYPNGAPL